MGRLDSLVSKVSNRIAVRDKIQSQLTDLINKQKKTKIQKIRKERALELVKDVALKTQGQLEYHLSDMVSTGLNTVFDTVYDFKVQFVIRRGKTECDLYFEKDGELAQPKFSGGGTMDIAAFCLRCAAWSMNKQYRPVLVLDEPFSHLKGEKENIRAIQLMGTLSHELKLQIICVNDERCSREDIIKNSDKVFEVKRIKGESRIKIIK